MKTKQNKKSNSQNQKSKTENKKPNKSLVWFDFSLIFILYSSLSFFAHPRTEIASGRRGEIGDSLCVLSQGADSLASTVREYNEFLEFRIRTMKGVDTNEMIHQVSQKQLANIAAVALVVGRQPRQGRVRRKDAHYVLY